MQDLSSNSYYFPTGQWQCIFIKYPPFSDKLPTASAELGCTSDDTHTKTETYNTSFVPAALASCMIQATIQDHVSYIQYIECNSTTVSKCSDQTIYTREYSDPSSIHF